tara:strand:- start:387 stop:503 length:117 start_codon:yes stop_codon:yes gene_type:complete
VELRKNNKYNNDEDFNEFSALGLSFVQNLLLQKVSTFN